MITFILCTMIPSIQWLHSSQVFPRRWSVPRWGHLSGFCHPVIMQVPFTNLEDLHSNITRTDFFSSADVYFLGRLSMVISSPPGLAISWLTHWWVITPQSQVPLLVGWYGFGYEIVNHLFNNNMSTTSAFIITFVWRCCAVLVKTYSIDPNNIFYDRVAPNGKLTTEFWLPTRWPGHMSSQKLVENC